MISLYQKILSIEKILILSHQHPDEDARGSCQALKEVLIKLGKKATVYLEGEENEEINVKSNTFDLVFILDCSARDFVAYPNNFSLENNSIIVIDHHQPTNDWENTDSLILPNACSTAEILYLLFRAWSVEISPTIAQNLLSGILDDTGGLIYDYSKSMVGVFKIVADLMRFNQNFHQLISKIKFNNYQSESKVKLTGELLKQSVIDRESKLLFLEIDEEEIKNSDGRISTDELIGEINDVQEAEVCCLIRNKNQKPQRVSLRSRQIDISPIAKRFGGGGHKKAAGFSARELSREKILEEVTSYILSYAN